MIDTLLIQRDLTDAERMMFQGEFNAVRRETTTGVLLAILLGGVGAHHFYTGCTGLGAVYLIFSWTFIPMILGIVEGFMMPERIKRYNDQKATEIVSKLKVMRELQSGATDSGLRLR